MTTMVNECNVKGLEFNNKRSCGLWLILVGAVLVISIIFGGKFLINPITFLIGYYVSFYIANINKKIRSKLSQGKASKFQIKMIYVSIALLFVLMFCIAGPFIPSLNWRLIWLGVNLATALHFGGFYFVHGKSMILLGIICTALAVCGYLMPGLTLLFLTLDAVTKLSFGIWMLAFSKPTKTTATIA